MSQLTLEPCLTFTFCMKKTAILWSNYSLLSLFKIEVCFCTPCSLKHYLQYPRHGSKANVHRQMNGCRRCGARVQWNITQHKKEQNNAVCSDVDGSEDGPMTPDSGCTPSEQEVSQRHTACEI